MVSTVARYLTVCTGTTNPAGTYTYAIGPITKLTYNGDVSPTTATLLVSNPVDIAPGTCVDVLRLDGAPLYVGLDPQTQVTVTQSVVPAGTQLSYTQKSEELLNPPICLGPPPPDAATCVNDIYGSSSAVTTTLNWYHGSAISFWNVLVPQPIPPRTIGYWMSWSSCIATGAAPVLDQTLATFPIEAGKTNPGVYIGAAYVDACLIATRLLNKLDVSTGLSRSGDGSYNLAAQLLAAELNVQRNAYTCPALTTAIADAQALLTLVGFTGIGPSLPSGVGGLTAARRTQALALANTLDIYNNSRLCSP